MINFYFTGYPYPSFEQQENDRAYFLEKLGQLKDEFNEKNGKVIFNYSFPDTDNRRIEFEIDSEYDLPDFIIRFNKQNRNIQ